ncbi:MAG: prepilin peptidase [Nanoarchaeota archaeon]
MIYLKYFNLFLVSFCIIVFIWFFYLDMKKRRIPNKNFIFLYIGAISSKIIETQLMTNFSNEDVYIYFNNLLCSTIIVLIFYFLSFIGGADGKLIIFLFLFTPYRYSELGFVFKYFTLFLLLEFFFFLVIYLFRSFSQNSETLDLISSLLNKNKFKDKFHIYLCVRLKDLKELKNLSRNKYLLISYSLFNTKQNFKFHVILRLRIQLIIIVELSYLLYFFDLIF